MPHSSPVQTALLNNAYASQPSATVCVHAYCYCYSFCLFLRRLDASYDETVVISHKENTAPARHEVRCSKLDIPFSSESIVLAVFERN